MSRAQSRQVVRKEIDAVVFNLDETADERKKREAYDQETTEIMATLADLKREEEDKDYRVLCQLERMLAEESMRSRIAQYFDEENYYDFDDFDAY